MICISRLDSRPGFLYIHKYTFMWKKKITRYRGNSGCFNFIIAYAIRISCY